MTLIKCPEHSCDRMVSEQAEVCPKCGCPVRVRTDTEAGQSDVRPPQGSERLRLATLVVRRSIANDEVPSATILIHSLLQDSEDSWAAHGAVSPGETLSIQLVPGRYRVQASVGEYLDESDPIEDNDDVEDSAYVEIELFSGSTFLLSTRAWQGSSLYVDLETRDDFDDEDDLQHYSISEHDERGVIQLPGSSRKRSAAELQALRAQAESWVNGYTATAVGTVLVTALVPGAATGILCALEATMCLQIGKMYKPDFSKSDAAKAAGTIGLAALAGKIVALEAAILTGPFAFAVKPAIAGGIVKAMGQLVINYFEESHN